MDPSEAAFDVAIVGAGIIGLSTALELALAGQRVAVLERGGAMREASWAAAGMLAGRDPETPPPLRALAEYSLRLYPGWLSRVEALSGARIPRRTNRTLQGFEHPPIGLPTLSRRELAALVPGVNPGDLKFISIEEDSLDPRDLTSALPAAVRAAGVALLEHASVARVESSGPMHRIAWPDGTLTAHNVVFATGAWPLPVPGIAPVFPRKGQMIAVELDGEVQTSCVLRTEDFYIVPRGDGRYIVGATVEDAGFDKSTDSAMLEALHRKAAALWPPIAAGAVVEAWAGLRPATLDELPIIGPLSGAFGECRWAATGHFRNGILLAPATGRVICDLVLGRQPEVDLASFRCDRFAVVPV